MTALKAVTASKVARTPKLRRRMVPVAALAAGAALALSGCGAGQISQTADQVAAVNGNAANVGRISLRNVHIVFPEADAGEHNNSKGGKAVIALSIINNSETTADDLKSVTTDLGTVVLTPAPGKSSIEIAPQQTVVAAAKAPAHAAAPAAPAADNHGAPATGHAAPSNDPEAKPALIEITGLTRDITPGLTYNVLFNFNHAGSVSVQVPVDAGKSERKGGEKSASAEGEHKGGGH
ncbi:hypothetical protein [Nocardia sp. NPDC052566]|uniref:hypothetical protein n=1 Tax=Nocardia sp. NPDC052566 TaxID=3364330 RepID=UPI0037CB4E11